LVHLAVAADGISSPVLRHIGEERAQALADAVGASVGDLVLVVADRDVVAQEALGKVRLALGEQLRLVSDPDELSYVWVHRFPMYQWDDENARWDATHNPFSGVVPEDEELLVTASGDPSRPSPSDPAGRARAMQYDVALNGWELGGGSVRIHRRELLERSFALMGHSLEGMRDKFGALLDAFEYGAPPHGGIAIGVDRWAARLLGQDNIREVMAFPKTGAGSDLMLGAPSPVDPSQLTELGLQLAPRRSEG
jgi:aspartyl-tRNA synthetase